MQIDPDHLPTLARTIALEIPAEDRTSVALRLSMTLTAMERIERLLGAQMDTVDPIPPVEIDRAFLYDSPPADGGA